MSQPGLGVMLATLYGSGENADKYYGRVVERGQLLNDGDVPTLQLALEDGVTLLIQDQGQSCCESRYMTCDDNLANIFGGRLLAIEVLDGPDLPSGETHEQQFLIIRTTEGTITVASHNEHNGYYGGFALRITERQHPS